MTLLRTIKCPSQMSDSDLLKDMERLLGISKTLPLTAKIRKPANSFSPLFRFSSLVMLKASPEVKSYRKNILRILKANDYSIGFIERLTFYPHITIRLGVPFTEKAKIITGQSFKTGDKLSFSKWMILRDIKKDGKYLVREVSV